MKKEKQDKKKLKKEDQERQKERDNNCLSSLLNALMILPFILMCKRVAFYFQFKF